MTLVPIIYTSLLIFSAILLFVILVSYISFKAKGGARKSFEIKQLHSANIKPAYVSIPSTPAQNYREVPVVHPRTSQIQYAKNNAKSASVRNQQEQYYSEHKYSIRNASPKANRLTREERISIVNSPVSYSHQNLQNSSTQKVASHRLADLNMLNYYSDKTGTEFITLSA